MNLDILRVRLRDESDIERLRDMAMTLVKCIGNDSAGGGYRVVNDHNPPYALYTGSRENCCAFIEGYDSAPLTDVGCFDHSVNCVCVDTPSCMIVIPEQRFGESLANKAFFSQVCNADIGSAKNKEMRGGDSHEVDRRNGRLFDRP